MGKDKKAKKAKDKGNKYHAPKVGKKVKAGSKGVEPEYDVAAAKERVAAKKAAREAEKAYDPRPPMDGPEVDGYTGYNSRPIDVKADAETNTKAHEKAKKAKAAERAEREEEAINAKAETEKPKGDTGGSVVFDETDLGPLADAVEGMVKDAVKALDTAPEVVETETGREFVGVDTSRRDANQARVSEVLAALAEPGLKKKAKAELEGTLVGLREEGKLIEAEMAKAAEARQAAQPVAEDDSFESAAKTVRRTKDGRPYVMLPDGSKEVIYTRMTTFIDCLEDKSALGRWYKRVVLAGAAVDSALTTSETIVERATAADRVFRDGIAKLGKKLAKGKLEPGEVQAERAELEKALKTELDSLADEAFTLGEGRVKAEHGTHLHKLTELVDLGQPLPEDTSPEDLADIEAYQAAMKAYGLKVKDVEVVVVNDELKVLGTADRTLLYKAPGAARAITVVGDIKTGRIDYGAGKIAMQIGGYATSKRYDPENPTERAPLGASAKLGLLIHLPAGEARCDIYEVDLVKGLAGLKLAVQVRSWRSETRTGANIFTPVEAPAS